MRSAASLFASLAAVAVFATATVATQGPANNQRSSSVSQPDRPGPDRRGDAVTIRERSLQSDDGTIPEGALLRAKAQRDRLKNTPGVVRPGAGLAWSSWIPLGPANIAGPVRAILIDPTSPSTMVLGSAGGGIWRTTNGGSSWGPVDDFMANLAVATMVASPVTFNVQYAGTGDRSGSAETRGAGIFKSIDRGVTWFHLVSTDNSDFRYVKRLAISPDATTLLAATSTGIFRSTDGGGTFESVSIDSSGEIEDVDFHPSDGSKAIAVSAGQAYYSTSGGASFDPATGIVQDFGLIEAAYAVSSPNVVYLTSSDQRGTLYKSSDGGVSYTEFPQSEFDWLLSSTVGGSRALFVDPTNAEVLIVGGDQLYRSIDGGVSFAQVTRSNGGPTMPSGGHHTIVPVPGFDALSVRGAFFGSDGGIHGTSDVYTVGNDEPAHANGWQAFNSGLVIAQFTSVAAHDDTGKVVGGTQHDGTLTYTREGGAGGWVRQRAGAAGHAAIDQSDPNYCYGQSPALRLYRSGTGCGENSASDIYYGITDAPGYGTAAAPFVLDPSDQRRLFTGSWRLWRTADVRAPSPSWSPIDSPPEGLNTITAIAIQEGNPDYIWIGYDSGAVYGTPNGSGSSPSWFRVGESELPARLVTRIAIDRNDFRTVFVTFGGFDSSNIWKTTDAGTTWTNIHGWLPAAPIRSIVINPANSEWLYIGTDTGIFASEDGGQSWFIPHDGPANVPVEDIVYSGSALYMATRGRGVYRATVAPYLLGKVRQIAPAGYVGDTTPTYRWQAEDYAAWYFLWVDDATGNRVARWYTASDAGCEGGGVCEVSPGTVLTAGAARWWVRPWNSFGDGPWSSGLSFNTGHPAAEILATYPVQNVQPGYSAALWLNVRNTGNLPLPGGSQAYYWVTGPGVSGYVGSVDVSGLAGGTSGWFLLQWDAAVALQAGAFTYWGRIWNAALGAWISPWSAGQNFTVLGVPASGARILSTYQVDGAIPGGAGRLWALVKNVGATTLDARVWFHVYGVGWIGSVVVSGLASGASGWYHVDWTIASGRPPGTHWYLAQLWNPGGTVALSPPGSWQSFTVGFDAPFTTGMNGFSEVVGSWAHTGGTYLYTAGVGDLFALAAYQSTTFSNVDFTVRIWLTGNSTSPKGVIVRGAGDGGQFHHYGTAGYAFLINGEQDYTVHKAGFNRERIGLGSGRSAAIVPGNAWNVLRVIANDSQLSFYVNGTLIWSGADAEFKEGKVAVGGYKTLTESGFGFWVDYATLAGVGVPASTPSKEPDKLPD